MQKRFLSLMAIVAVLLFTSCSKDNKEGRYIPANAAAVLHINGKSINDKLPWAEVKENEAFKKFMADTTLPASAKAIMENPENSGIDITSDMAIFLVKDSAGGYAGIVGGIKDEAKFKTFLQTAHRDGKEVIKDGYTYRTDNKSSIAFNKDRFFIAVDVPQLNYMKNLNPMQMPDNSGMAEVKTLRDLNSTAAQLIGLKEDKSLAKNEKFTELMKTKGDLHMWYSAQNFMSGADLGPMAAMANINKLTDGAVFTGTVNFEDGKISFDAKSYMSKDLADIYKKYGQGELDKSMVKNIPTKNIAGLFIVNFKPEGIREILKLVGVDGLANMGVVRFGFNMDDVIKGTKGDMLIAVGDLTVDTAQGTDAKYLFSASVGDKTSFNKLLAAGKKFGGINTDDSLPSKVNYAANDKYFAFSNNKAMTDAYLAGKANSSFDFMDKISGGAFGGYVNFQYILGAIRPKTDADSSQIAAHSASIKLWDNMYIKGGEFKDGGVSQHWEVNMMDKKTNSLKQLNKYLGTMAALEEARRKKQATDWEMQDMNRMDSMMPPVPDTVATP